MSISQTAGRLVGQRVKRKEDPRLLTGQGEYVDDVVMVHMWHAAFLRSDVAKARITRLDVSAAAAMPGVLAVFTGPELESAQGEVFHSMMGGISPLPFRPLANGDVRFVGDPVALVVAESRYLAEDACELIEVDWEVLEPVVDYASADEPGRGIVNGETTSNVLMALPFRAFSADLKETFANAAHVVETTIESHRYINVPMEGRGILASWHRGRGELEVVMATQAVHQCQEFFSHYLGVAQSKITVSVRDVGGGFGQKMFVGREEAAIVLATRKLGVPVKWIEDRRENLLSAPHARNENGAMRIAIDADGMIEAITVENKVDIGAYAVVPAGMNTALLPGPYKIPRLGFSSSLLFTNTMGKGAYRGPWLFETTAREMMIDYAAHEIGMDPIEIRRRNLLTRADLPFTSPGELVFSEISPAETLEQALEMLDYPAFRREQEAARAEGRWLGLGVSAYVEPSGYTMASLGTESATVRVETNGEVTVLLGSTSHGQGIETTMAQIAADALGVDYDTVTVIQATTHTPFGPGTGGSRTAVISGGATREASLAVRDRLLDVAEHLLEASAHDLDIAEGVIAVKGSPRSSVSVIDVARAVYYNSSALPDDLDTTLEFTSRFRPSRPTTWSNATHLCVVEIDPGTYQARILRYIVSEDCGRMINPMIVEGQISGGVVQGIGGVLLEEFVYDDAGNPLTTTFMDYLLPTTTDVPMIEIGHLETPSSTNPGGFKGVGEGGAIGSHAAVANAVADALAHLGVRVTKTPLGPHEIFNLVQAARAQRAATARE
jgi:carbon-monoxide dehydrogenase large subunit